MDIQIPESFDDQWLREMLRELKVRLEIIETQITDFDLEVVIESHEIVDALQQFAGY